MRIETAKSMMMFVATAASVGDLETVGCTEEDYELMTQDRMWTAVQSVRVRKAFFAIMEGANTLAGAQKLQKLCAEYVACCICMFIHPINSWTMCSLVGNVYNAEDLTRGSATVDSCTPEQLHGMVCELWRSKEHSQAVAQFERFTGKQFSNQIKKAIDYDNRSKELVGS